MGFCVVQSVTIKAFFNALWFSLHLYEIPKVNLATNLF